MGVASPNHGVRQLAGIDLFQFTFDKTAVEFLEELNVTTYKTTSFENNHLPLITKVSATGKSLIISTGMAKRRSLILLKCTSTYPASPENTIILTIHHMRDLFYTEVGLSDQTMRLGDAVASVSLGASVIEKHFTLVRADGGVESAYCLEPNEMAALVEESKSVWQAIGHVHYSPKQAESKKLVLNRSIYVSKK